MTMVKQVRKEFWEHGVHTYGYEFGKVHTDFYVKLFYPACFTSGYPIETRIYKTLAGAERAIKKFKKNNYYSQRKKK